MNDEDYYKLQAELEKALAEERSLFVERQLERGLPTTHRNIRHTIIRKKRVVNLRKRIDELKYDGCGTLPLKTKLPVRYKKTPSGCWECVSHCRQKKGYVSVKLKGKTTQLHRASYELVKGNIPKGLLLRHKCDNPPCINPDHLLPGTNQDNMNDLKARRKKPVSFGEDVGSSKLTNEQAKYIFNCKEKNVDLARRFGVAYTTVYGVRKGYSWNKVLQNG